MKKQERKEHPPTIPLWVKLGTGNIIPYGDFPTCFKGMGTAEAVIKTIAWFVFFGFFSVCWTLVIASWCGMIILFLLGIGAMEPVRDPNWGLILLATCGVAVTPPTVIVTVYWILRVRGLTWLQTEWRRLTGKVQLPSNKVQAVTPLQSLTDRPEDFHLARDIAVWLGYCDPKLRPRDVAQEVRLQLATN